MTNGGGHPPKTKRQKLKGAQTVQRPLNQQSLVDDHETKRSLPGSRKNLVPVEERRPRS